MDEFEPSMFAVPVSLINGNEQIFVSVVTLRSQLRNVIRVNMLENESIGVEYLQQDFLREFVDCRARRLYWVAISSAAWT
jgi:hypothetical protein